MWDDIFDLHIPVAEKVIRILLVYILILTLFRFTGKRGLASLNAFDFVVIFLLSNVVQNAIIGNDQSVTGGVIGAVTLVAVNAALNRWLAVDERAARVIEGTPTTVIEGENPSRGLSDDWHCDLKSSRTLCANRQAARSAAWPTPVWNRTGASLSCSDGRR
jgi:hypothetical protein